jgi:hypothetical protein
MDFPAGVLYAYFKPTVNLLYNPYLTGWPLDQFQTCQVDSTTCRFKVAKVHLTGLEHGNTACLLHNHFT